MKNYIEKGIFLMVNERVRELAHILVNHSCEAKTGDKVMIDLNGDEKELAIDLVQEIYKVGAIPFVQLNNQQVHRELLMGIDEPTVDFLTQLGLEQMKQMDCYIGIRGSDNISELSDVPSEKMKLYSRSF